MHILVVEDEKALCETIARSLRRLDYSVDYCYDGNKAIELLGIESYDLVLLDLNLPGADGMTVLRKRLPIRWTGLMPEQMTIYPSPFIWKSWRQEYAA